MTAPRVHLARNYNGLTIHQATRRANEPTVAAVTHGLGNRVLYRWWRITDNRSPFVRYIVGGEERKIFGFRGRSAVFSRITQEGDQIRVHFYPDEPSARSQTGLISVAVLSERERKGKIVGPWVPLKYPRVVDSSPNGARKATQRDRILSARVHTFLTTDQQVGAHIDLPTRAVRPNGDMHFGFNGGRVVVSGYRRFAGNGLPGRVVAYESEKRAYFWRTEAARDEERRALRPKGHLFALPNDGMNSGWVVRLSSSSGRGSLIQESERYGNYLYGTVGPKQFTVDWRITPIRESRGRVHRRAQKRIRGNMLCLCPPKDHIGEVIVSVTREIGGRLKLIEFWRNRNEIATGRPFDSRFVTFKPDHGSWRQFWARMDEYQKFKALIQDGLITRRALIDVLSDDYFFRHYASSLFPAVVNRLMRV